MNAIQAQHTLVTLAYVAMGIMGLMLIASLAVLFIIVKYRHGVYAAWNMIKTLDKQERSKL